MKRGWKVFSVGIFISFSLIFILEGVSAAAVGNATFNSNASVEYDEGTFFINWTNNSIDSSYRIFMFINDTGSNTFFYMATNNSAISGAGVWTYGINFTNTTEANYTFIIEAVNATSGNLNSTNISMYVDRTAPTITLPVYTNATAKKNTATLTLNISVVDASSGVTGSVCLINANSTGANQSVAVSGGWCNTTSISLTGTADGNKTVNIWVNDTVGIFGLNNSFVVLADTTVPTASASCSPTTVYTGDSITCSCSGADATSGVSSTAGGTTSTTNTGSFSYGCTITDNAGNTASATAAYTVEQSVSPSSTATTTPWITHTISDEVFEAGHTRELAIKNRMKVQVDSEEHFIGLVSISGNEATIEISSDPVQVTLSEGEDAKVDVTDDGFYDIYVLLNELEL